MLAAKTEDFDSCIKYMAVCVICVCLRACVCARLFSARARMCLSERLCCACVERACVLRARARVGLRVWVCARACMCVCVCAHVCVFACVERECVLSACVERACCARMRVCGFARVWVCGNVFARTCLRARVCVCARSRVSLVSLF